MRVSVKKFMQLDRGLRWTLAVILVLSLVLNVVSLFLPFTETRVGTRHAASSLVRMVSLLWHNGFYALTALVAGFSGFFPFVKLGILGSIAAGLGSDGFRTRGLRLVARLGKWSLLDIFIVSLIMTLVDDRVFVAGIPRAGATMFMIAIVLSMVASEIMERAMLGPAEISVSRSFYRPWRIGILVGTVLASAVLVGALLIPSLWVNDWRLVDGPVSIVGAVPALMHSRAWFLAIAVGAFLVVAPLTVQVLDLVSTATIALGLSWNGVFRWSEIIRRWSMLDVFGLALLIFLLEGKRMIRTDLGLGATALAITSASYRPLVALVRWLLRKGTVRAA